LDTVRIARDFGTVSELLPAGIDDLRDCPYPLFEAIRHALVVLSWDQLPKKERPPRSMWDDGEALQGWFARIERERERDMRSGEIEDPVTNDAASMLIAE
jgi:hypothetical protein